MCSPGDPPGSGGQGGMRQGRDCWEDRPGRVRGEGRGTPEQDRSLIAVEEKEGGWIGRMSGPCAARL